MIIYFFSSPINTRITIALDLFILEYASTLTGKKVEETELKSSLAPDLYGRGFEIIPRM